MQRMRRLFLLTLAAFGGRLAGAQGSPGRASAADIEITEVVSVRDGVPARLCVGADNALRVRLAQHGAGTQKPVPLRLFLVLPGGPSTGSLMAEGSASPPPTGQTTTFTFSHVEIVGRLRGRGARLVVRANADRTIDGAAPTNDARELRIDDATDWSCRG